jgi:hypothetical protein
VVAPGRRAAPLVALAAVLGACGGAAPHGAAVSDAQRSAVQRGVRLFMGALAADVTRAGPTAWNRAFSTGPEFFMAANGQLVFADGAAATRGIEQLTHTLPKVSLHFGDDLRVAALTPTLAAIGVSYAEVLTNAQGQERTDRGYFTGVALLDAGRWRLCSAHWSSKTEAAAAGEH